MLTNDLPVLVTGATGKVGSRFVPRLIAAGHPVRALVRDPESGLALALRAAGADLTVGDLTAMDEPALKAAVTGTGAVVHLAAAFRNGETLAQATAVNTDAAAALARAALDAGVERFVFASTNLVYGADHDDAQHEDSELRPDTLPSPYPVSKAAAETALAELHAERGLDLRIARLAFVYGEGDPHIEEFLRRPAPRHPASRLQMVHHADVGQGLIRALLAEGVAGEAFNIADDSAVTYSEILRYVGRPPADRAEGASRPEDPWFGIVDTRKARRVLGYRPIYPTMYQAIDAGAM
jgi:nucleoside-diphosphate-sugar epimerase